VERGIKLKQDPYNEKYVLNKSKELINEISVGERNSSLESNGMNNLNRVISPKRKKKPTKGLSTYDDKHILF
jgi:hypothetical protein